MIEHDVSTPPACDPGHAPGPNGGADGLRAVLSRALFGSPREFDRVHAPWRSLLAGEAFRSRRPGSTPAERAALSYRRLRMVDDAVGSAEGLAADYARLASLHEWTAGVDGGLATLIGIHYNLFLGSLLDHDHDERRDLAGVTAMRSIGTFLCTELDHGNDAGALRTTAAFDPSTGGFILHTPVAGARKFMPNTGAWGGPKTGLVAARLIIGDADHGVFLFLVRLTDDSGPLPGVSVEPLEQKAGSPVDHCLTSFDRVVLPAGALLAGEHGRLSADGVFTSALGSRRKRFLRSIDRVTVGKLCMSAAALGGARTGLAAAIGYGGAREITAMQGRTRMPVFALRSHHGPLVSGLATAYAMSLLHRETVRDYTAAGPEGRERAARTVAITKGWVTWNARAILTECRERCGARGLFPANRLAALRDDTEGLITAEGDNLAVWIKAGAEMLLDHPVPAPPADPAGRRLTDPDFLMSLLRACERIHLTRARARLRQAPAGNALRRWNAAVPFALGAVTAFAQRRAAEALLCAAVEQGIDPSGPHPLASLLRLFALERIAEQTGDLVSEGCMDSGHVSGIPSAVEDHIAALAPQAGDLVAAFRLPDEVVDDIPIAGGRLDDGLTVVG
ncbi:acyl-CoA dehydrogenase [Nocardiopsis mangrovi]|uniref:Acyl-CoA dehydrogenase n=1 Tax=Nocardiopsis mangrovi TaxID=1179818 RepID=A0ABV9E3R9_9ACTN